MAADSQPARAPHEPEPAEQSHAQVPAQSEPPPAEAPASHAAPATRAPNALAVRTRLSGLWIAIGCFAIVLIFLLIFIVQNGSKVNISYLGMHIQMPLGVAMLTASLVGTILTVLAGTARILQLRTAARRRAKH